MLNSLTRLFHAPRSRETGTLRSARARKASRRQQGDSLTLQSLESRLALSVSTSITSLNDAGTEFAWNILIGDAQDATGGRDWYFQKLPTGGALLADNPGFQNAKTLGLRFSDSTCTTIFVASGGIQTSTFASIAPTFTGSYDYVLPIANPLEVSGQVSIGGGLSFTYAASGLTYRTGSSFAALTITPNDAAAWTAAGFGTPTGTISTLGGISTLEFQTVDAATPAAPIDLPQFDLFNFSYQYLSAPGNPQSFTVAPGHNSDQRLIVDLSPVGSSISINSPWQASAGNAATEGPEVFYSTYSNFTTAGNVCLFASTVNIEQSITSTSLFVIGGQTQTNPVRYRKSGSNTPTVALNVNAVMQAPRYDLELTGSATAHANLVMSEAGAFVGASATAAAGSLTLIGDYTDVQYLGLVAAAQQSYLLRAEGSVDQYQFTTRSSDTGVQAGTIAGGTVALTLGQPAGGMVDLRTDVSNLRFDSGIDASSMPYAYTVNIEEADDLTVDAVGSSSAPISIRSGVVAGTGDLTILGSAVRTVSDLSLATPGTLTLNGAVTTGDGDIQLSAASLSVSTKVTAGGNRSVSLNSALGATNVSSLVQAGGTVKESVRVATTANITLSGTQTIDGITLIAGDRVLVKNQTTASQNGIYVVRAGAAWTRASDANTANLLVPGFTVFATEGNTQEGGWTFRNAANPIVDSTGLSFVPTTATIVFNPVRLATTSTNANLLLSGQCKARLPGNTTNSSRVITNIPSTGELTVGMLVTGTGIPANTTIASIDSSTQITISNAATAAGIAVTLDFLAATSGNTTNSSQVITNIPSTGELTVGMLVTGDGIQANTTITSIDSPTRITISNAATATAASVSLGFQLVLDGTPVFAGDRILAKNQTDPSDNGIYVASTRPWTRASDADTVAELRSGAYAFVTSGTTNGGKGFALANDAVEVGTTPLTFQAFSVRTTTPGTGDTTNSSTVITNIPTTSELTVGMLVTGSGIPANTIITSIDSPTKITVSNAATATATAVAINFLTATRTNVWSPANVLSNADVATTNSIDLSSLMTKGGQPAVDGVTVYSRVLVKNQANSTENGVYAVNSLTSKWTRATDASIGADLMASTAVFVKYGTQNQNTAWNIDNSITQTATTVKDSAVVTGLFSTQSLSVGMLVVGAGIPANTLIAAINPDGQSIRLSANATLPVTNTPVSFLNTSAITLGTTPLRFLPVGGDVAVTSATDVTGASRLQGSTVVLTAGTAGKTGIINAATTAGELIASAPSSITLDNAAPVELTNVRTTVGGSITATSKGTLTATYVSATGISATPATLGNVSLASQFGDVVAGTVLSTLGDITLVASNANVLITTGTTTPANVSAQAGNVSATADFGTIQVDGRVQAQGAGSDVTLSSANGTVNFTALANVSAADQFTISVPTSTPTVIDGAHFAAAMLNYTAKFGAEKAPPASLGPYDTVKLSRTDAGDIDYTVGGTLTVAGASTFNGSITFKAAALTVTGAIAPNGTAKDVSLTADSSDILIDSTIKSTGNLFLYAKQGTIGGSGGVPTAKLTVPGEITLEALSSAQLTTQAAVLKDATLTGANAVLVINEDDTIDIKSVKFNGTGGTATIAVGSPALGGAAKIGLIDAGTTGTVAIKAYGDILENTVDLAAADVVAQTLALTSTAGSISLDTDVAVLSATTLQAGKSLSIRDVGTGDAAGLELQAIVGAGPVTVVSVGAITATSVTTTGTINLTTTDSKADILVNSLSATANTITLSAGRSIIEVSPGDTTPDVSGLSVVLTAGTGSIDVYLAASAVTATATTPGSSITLNDDNGLSVAGIVSNTGNAIAISAGGNITQTGPVTGGGVLDVKNNAGSVTLDSPTNDVKTLSISNPGRAITYRDSSGFDIGANGLNGGAVTLTGNGNLTQTGLITATSLSVTDTAGSIDFDRSGNKVGSLFASNGIRPVIFKTDTALQVTGIQAGDAFLRAGGDVTQTAVITAAIYATKQLDVTTSVGSVTLDNPRNDVVALSISNPGRAITYRDYSGFGIGANGLSGSAIVLVGNGFLTQTGLITATSLSVTDTAGSINFDLPGNKVGSLSASNGDRPVFFKTDTALQVTGLQADSAYLRAGGGITQTAAIKASSLLDITTSAGSVTLDRSDNVVASLSGSNPGRPISFTDSTGFGIGANGLSGGAIVLVGNGNLTQTGLITATSLSVTDAAGSIDFDLPGNKVGSLSASNGDRPVIFKSDTGLQVTGLQAGAAFLRVGGDLTQTVAINASSLDITSSAGAVTLTNEGNTVGSLGTVSNPGGDVNFVNALTFATTAITAGTADVGDGNILLKSVSGDINVTGDLTAKNDRVTLEARNGTFSLLNGSKIDAFMLVYYVATPPSLGGGSIPPIVASNGDLSINSPNPVTFGGYTTDGNISITGPSVTISGLLQTTGTGKTVALTATTGNITFVGAGAIDNDTTKNGVTTLSAASGTVTALAGTKVSGATTSLTVGQAVTFPGTIDATTLTATGAGTAISLTGANTLGTVGVTNGSNVVINDTTGPLALSGITATGSVTVTAAGAVTQSGVISGGALSVGAAGNPITLNTQNNTVTSFASSNGVGSIAFKDTTGGLILNGITTTGSVTIDAAGGAVTQSAAISAGALTVNAAGSPITLNTQNNTVTSFASTNGAGNIAFKDTAGGLSLNGITTTGSVTIDATGGAVTQSAAISAGALTVNAAGNPITLNTYNNTVTSFASTNGAGNITFKDTTGGLSLNGITTTGSVTIDAAGGAVTQTAAISAATLTVNNMAGNPITLTQANKIGSFSSSNAGGSITLTDADGDLTLNTITSGPLTVVAAGKVLANQVQITGNATITTANGGGLDVGPLANGLLKSTGQLDLRGVQGQVRLINGGQIIGNPILVNSSNPINIGGVITTTEQLNQAVTTVNALPAIVGSTYEIIVGANLVLTQTLVANRPMTLRGTSAAITLNGSATATTGMTINTGGSGSRVTSLAFSGFSGTGIQMNAAQNVAVTGVTVNYSGFGLSVTGTSTGSTVRGNTFNFCPNAIALSSATGVTIGGTVTGQANRITSSARAGVFATGVCTNSSVIRTAFANTPVRYNTASSRNLRIVQ